MVSTHCPPDHGTRGQVDINLPGWCSWLLPQRSLLSEPDYNPFVSKAGSGFPVIRMHFYIYVSLLHICHILVPSSFHCRGKVLDTHTVGGLFGSWLTISCEWSLQGWTSCKTRGSARRVLGCQRNRFGQMYTRSHSSRAPTALGSRLWLKKLQWWKILNYCYKCWELTKSDATLMSLAPLPSQVGDLISTDKAEWNMVKA